MKTFMALLAVLCLGLFAITPAVSTEITNTSTSILVVEEGSIPATELCNTADGKAFPGDTVTLYYTIQNTGYNKLTNVTIQSKIFGKIKPKFTTLIPMQVTQVNRNFIAPSKLGFVNETVTLYADQNGKAKITILPIREAPLACKCPNQ